MNLEKFVKSPYRALVMVIITLILGFLGYHYLSHISGNLPEKEETLIMSHVVWLIPSLILAYVWCAATAVSFVMIFAKRPLKYYNDAGLIFSLIVGLIAGLIVGLIFSLIFGLIEEFKKPKEELRLQNQHAS